MIEQAQAEADERVSAAEADRDQARADAAQVEESAWLAQQEATRAQAAADAARAETGRVRADAEKMLAGFRAEAAAELAAVRADLRARAERAEQQADAYRAELAQIRTGPVRKAALATSAGQASAEPQQEGACAQHVPAAGEGCWDLRCVP